MKVLVTGAAGQLGHDVMIELRKRGHEGIGVDISEMDITNYSDVERVLMASKPDAVIHCAAWTTVDLAEEENMRDQVRAVNCGGTKNIAALCGKLGTKLLYLSTDYVFDGQGERPWKPDDPRHPLNVYGQTKYEGELAVETYTDRYFIVRIAWVFGVNGKNFIKTMLGLAKKNDCVTVVNDQIGTPTYTFDLARLLVDMIETDKYGRYHATNEGGYISWYEFACEIFRLAAESGDPECSQVRVIPVSSAEFPAKAKRPQNSRMDKSKLVANGFRPLPVWQDALRRYLKELGY